MHKLLILPFILLLFCGASSRSFDGNDHIDSSSADGGYFDPGSADHTLSMWVKTTSASNQVLAGLDCDFSDTLIQDQFCMRMKANGKVHHAFTAGGGVSCDSGDSTTSVNDGAWHFITARRDGDRTCEIWVDGVEENDGSYAEGFTGINTTAIFRVGEDEDGNEDFVGQLSNIQWFVVAENTDGAALSSQEINESMWQPGMITLYLRAFYPYWGASPETDLSGEGLDGAVTGATTSDDGPPVMFGGGLPL